MTLHRVILLCLLALSSSMPLAAAEGSLSVKTIPDGIEVWLDGTYVGDSPIEGKRLKSGRYTLKLVDPVQHTSTSEEIFIDANQTTTIEKTMRSKFGTLQVASDPEGADVMISTNLGKTPLTNNFMNPGKYRLEIRHPSKAYIPVVQEITIPRGEAANVSKNLERKTPFTKKALVRLGLGAITAVGYTWAIVENGNYKRLMQRGTVESLEEAKQPKVRRILGAAIGSTSLLALEIVAFF